MNADSLKLTVYFGESDRTAGRLLSDALVDLFEREQLRAAALMRGVEGFGIKHKLRSDRFLTLSEDLPLVAVAVDEQRRVEALLPELTRLVGDGLVTLERARLLHAGPGPVDLPNELDEATKLTVYLGRMERAGSQPAFRAAVDHLQAHGLAGATVLLGLDGMVHRRRQRARFLGRNASVPLLVVSVGPGEAVAAALPGLGALLSDPIVTVERVRVCKRDGERLAQPQHLPARDDAGLGVWQKLTVYASEQARLGRHPLHIELIRRLRESGAGGATAVRGIWGFSGDQPPHGDSLLRVRRRVPVVTSLVDTPGAIRRWFRIVDYCTAEAGLVTSELVPAYRAVGADQRVGGLRLARLRF